jgi:hypothetical protein
MKTIIKLITLLTITSLVFFACEEDERPYEMGAKITGTTGEVMLGFTEDQSKEGTRTISYTPQKDSAGNYQDYTTQLTAKVKGPAPTQDVTVDFIIDSTQATEGVEYTLESTTITIPKGKFSGGVDITLKSENMPEDSIIPFYIEITNVDGLSKSEYNQSGDIVLYRDCPLEYSRFNGTFLVESDGDTWESTVSQSADNENVILINDLWVAGDQLELTINEDGTITGETQIIFDGDYAGLGRVRMTEINGGIVTNKCTPAFEFNGTPDLPDSGYWWGGEFAFKLTRISSKKQDGLKSNDFRTPVKY